MGEVVEERGAGRKIKGEEGRTGGGGGRIGWRQEGVGGSHFLASS